MESISIPKNMTITMAWETSGLIKNTMLGLEQVIMVPWSKNYLQEDFGGKQSMKSKM